MKPPFGIRIKRRIAALRACRSGIALVEFALCLPVLMTLGMYGIEIAYMASVDMQLSQVALSVADNASRMEQTNNSGVTPTVTEADIDSVLDGAMSQGSSFQLTTKGRVILTSLEMSSTGKQYIHWQRCRGSLVKSSSYGDQGSRNGLTGAAITGMGKGTNKITASSTTSAVMYAEVYYRYEGIFGDLFVANKTFKEEAAFLVRDIRNLTAGVSGSSTKSVCPTT